MTIMISPQENSTIPAGTVVGLCLALGLVLVILAILGILWKKKGKLCSKQSERAIHTQAISINPFYEQTRTAICETGTENAYATMNSGEASLRSSTMATSQTTAKEPQIYDQLTNMWNRKTPGGADEQSTTFGSNDLFKGPRKSIIDAGEEDLYSHLQSTKAPQAEQKKLQTAATLTSANMHNFGTGQEPDDNDSHSILQELSTTLQGTLAVDGVAAAGSVYAVVTKRPKATKPANELSPWLTIANTNHVYSKVARRDCHVLNNNVSSGTETTDYAPQVPSKMPVIASDAATDDPSDTLMPNGMTAPTSLDETTPSTKHDD